MQVQELQWGAWCHFPLDFVLLALKLADWSGVHGAVASFLVFLVLLFWGMGIYVFEQGCVHVGSSTAVGLVLPGKDGHPLRVGGSWTTYLC